MAFYKVKKGIMLKGKMCYEGSVVEIPPGVNVSKWKAAGCIERTRTRTASRALPPSHRVDVDDTEVVTEGAAATVGTEGNEIGDETDADD